MFLLDNYPEAYEVIRNRACTPILLFNDFPKAYEAACDHLIEFRKFMEQEAIKWEKLVDKYPGIEFPKALEDYRSE